MASGHPCPRTPTSNWAGYRVGGSPVPAGTSLEPVTQDPRGGEGLKELRAELGSPPTCLHLEYEQQTGQWMRIEQTDHHGQAAGDQRYILVTDPIQDLITHMGAWSRGPAAIEVIGGEPHDLLAMAATQSHRPVSRSTANPSRARHIEQASRLATRSGPWVIKAEVPGSSSGRPTHANLSLTGRGFLYRPKGGAKVGEYPADYPRDLHLGDADIVADLLLRPALEEPELDDEAVPLT